MNTGTVLPARAVAREPGERKDERPFTLEGGPTTATPPRPVTAPADQGGELAELLQDVAPHRAKRAAKGPLELAGPLEKKEKSRAKPKGPQQPLGERTETAGAVQAFAFQLKHHGAATALTGKPTVEQQRSAQPSVEGPARRRGAEPTESIGPRAEQASARPTEAAAIATPSLPATRAAEAPAELARPAAPRPVQISPEHTLLQLALVDLSLQVDVRHNVVQVALQTEAAGALALEVRLHEGQTHVRLDGPASPLVAQRADELRAVLTQQGLSLGNFTSGQGHGQPNPALDVDDLAVPAAAPGRVNDPARARHEGRIDVEA